MCATRSFSLNNSFPSSSRACCRFRLNSQLQISICDRKRTNLLHAACEMGHGVLASALIERYKLSVEDKDRKGAG